MSSLNRRQCFTAFLDGLLGAAGTVVLASATLPARAAAGAAGPREEDAKDLEQRADQVAGAQTPPPGDEGQQFASFVNGGFANGGFRNGSSGGGGGFRNGGFANGGGGGGFRKGGWVNGGFRN
jgi:hypothetical protein